MLQKLLAATSASPLSFVGAIDYVREINYFVSKISVRIVVHCKTVFSLQYIFSILSSIDGYLHYFYIWFSVKNVVKVVGAQLSLGVPANTHKYF